MNKKKPPKTLVPRVLEFLGFSRMEGDYIRIPSKIT